MLTTDTQIAITLSRWDLLHAAQVGSLRYVRAALNGVAWRNGQDDDARAGNQIEGAAGEMAVAYALRRSWVPLGHSISGPDVDGLQVRTTSYDDGCLLLKPDDDDNATFVLVTGTMCSAPAGGAIFTLRGWIIGRDGKACGEWKSLNRHRPPCWCVDQQLLHPMSELVLP